ncbi:hypothetical protein Dimus_037526, partial [Dionaea muscipula]
NLFALFLSNSAADLVITARELRWVDSRVDSEASCSSVEVNYVENLDPYPRHHKISLLSRFPLSCDFFYYASQSKSSLFPSSSSFASSYGASHHHLFSYSLTSYPPYPILSS